MSYSLLTPGLSPDQFGSGMSSGLGGLLGRWGDATQRGLQGGMKLGTQLTQYGTSQRLAGLRENMTRQGLNTLMTRQQNGQIDAQTAQQNALCDRIAWDSDDCQAWKAKLEDRMHIRPQAYEGQTGIAGGSAVGVAGGLRSFDAGLNRPSALLGTSPQYDTYDSYDNQGGGQGQGWYE